MKNKLGSIVVLVALFAFTTTASAQDPNFHIYLCFGQSNMEGAGRAEEQDKTVDERFQVLQAVDAPNLKREKGKWYPAAPPLVRGRTGISPADYFGRTMVAHLPKEVRVGVVNVAVAGCKIELFDKDNYEAYAANVPPWMTGIIKEYGGSPYQRLVDMAKLAKKDGVIKGILLHQGESNTNDKQWPEKVKRVYDTLIKDLELDPASVPLLAGELVNADQNGACASMNRIIAELPKTIPAAHVISSAGLPCRPDRLHFTTAGYREFGKRYAEAMLSITETPPGPKVRDIAAALIVANVMAPRDPCQGLSRGLVGCKAATGRAQACRVRTSEGRPCHGRRRPETCQTTRRLPVNFVREHTMNKPASPVLTGAIVAALFAALLTPAVRADPVSATLDVDVDKPGTAIPKTFYGLMTEEINHSYDGGLYAELIQNRTFQDPQPRNRQATPETLPVHWSVSGQGKATLDRSDPVNAALPLSLRLDMTGPAAGVANDGYWGVPVRPDTTYTATFYAKGARGFTGPVTASLVLDDGNATVAKADSPAVTTAWQKYTVKLTTPHDAPTTAKAQFVLSATGTGSVSFSLVSLFPPTYQDKPNGLRPDLMKLMADMRPGFIRLPGGNYVEGGSFQTRFNWKQMIGPVDQRPGHMGCWGYRSSDGFGMPEYLLWCKQLNAEPVLALFAGYVLNRQHHDAGSPEMAQYTQEALEEIEYVSGPADSEWGKRRAADGFPEPFPLHYVEIGNEDWFDRSGSYDGRFTQMAKAIRERYPHLKIIATAPVKSFKPDLYDDHFYRSARQLMVQANQYDQTAPAPNPLKFNGGAFNGRQPDGILTFVGEWATQEGRPTPNLNAALADAAFVMGLERNADVIPMECYAPLLVNVSPEDSAKGYPKAWQWPTNLIGYDALRSFGSPSYYAQVMLGQNKGDVVLPATLKVAPAVAAAEPTPHGGIGVGTVRTQVEYKDVAVTTPDGGPLLTADQSKDTHGWQFTGGKWNLQDQAIKPSAADAESSATTGDPKWTDYTIRLKARKVAGREGLVVLWHVTDGDNYNRWNIGGQRNTMARCEAVDDGVSEAYGPSTPFQVETGRWYDLRLEVKGRHVRGFVDDKLVTEADERPHNATTSAFASATYQSDTHTVILKVVNAGKNPVDLSINLRGAASVEPTATAHVLTGDPKAQNTADEPTRITPKQETVTGASPSFRRSFPPHSFTVIRLTTAAR